MAAAAAAEQIPSSPSPPTYRFRPTKRELVGHYLLPRARGQDPFPGVLFEDDAAGSTLPWDLFERHGVGGEDEAYFLVHTTSEAQKRSGARARQDRGCDGGVGIWKMQSSFDKCLRVGGERIKVHVSNLNLHMGKGKDGGSVGWVMHEYTIAAPPCPSLVKICHIAFSGHGRKRMRVPDGQEVICQRSVRARVGATASTSALPCSGAMPLPYASGDGESSHLVLNLTDDDTFRQSPLLGSSSDNQAFQSAVSEQYLELEAQVPITEKQGIVAPQLIVQETTLPVAAQELSAGELEFWTSIGVDVQSDNSFEQEQTTGVQSNSVVPNTDDAIASLVQSSCAVPNNGAMATAVQSSYVVPSNGTMATGVQSISAVPSNSAMATGVQSIWAVPSNSAMAVDLDDFCRSVLGLDNKVQTNCAAPDFGNMATRTLGGGCSLIC